MYWLQIYSLILWSACPACFVFLHAERTVPHKLFTPLLTGVVSASVVLMLFLIILLYKYMQVNRFNIIINNNKRFQTKYMGKPGHFILNHAKLFIIIKCKSITSTQKRAATSLFWNNLISISSPYYIQLFRLSIKGFVFHRTFSQPVLLRVKDMCHGMVMRYKIEASRKQTTSYTLHIKHRS